MGPFLFFGVQTCRNLVWCSDDEVRSVERVWRGALEEE
jgi:hypothetical protein